ncbi:alpha/beta hydrolase [Pseudomonas qingdaonensis]|nr:alpha/beta hydrolase [Pseudomonas qingdaonensis]
MRDLWQRHAGADAGRAGDAVRRDGRLQLQALGRGHRLIMLHLPGCGEAELPPAFDIAHLVADIVVLLDQLGIDQPLPVIGYSFGGVLAQAFALAHPHRCAGLCISVSSPFSEGASNFPVLMGELQKSPRFATLNRGWNMTALPAYQQVIGDFDLRPQLGNLHCPCRIICASDDAYQPPAYSALIANAVPHAELIEVQGAGHLLGFTHHQRYNQLLLEFLHNLPTPKARPGTPCPRCFSRPPRTPCRRWKTTCARANRATARSCRRPPRRPPCCSITWPSAASASLPITAATS